MLVLLLGPRIDRAVMRHATNGAACGNRSLSGAECGRIRIATPTRLSNRSTTKQRNGAAKRGFDGLDGVRFAHPNAAEQ